MAKLAIDVVLNKAAAMTGLRGLEKDFMSFGRSVAGIAGIGGGLAGLVAGIDNILAKAGQLQDVSDAFNVSAESIQRLANVGITANLTIEEIGSKLGKLAKAAQSAAGTNDEMAKTFAKIGVTGQDLVRLNPEQLFNKLREAVSSGALAGEEFKIVNELLAKDFQRFMPLLRMTSEEFNRLASAAGITSDAMVAFLDAANVRLRQFQQQAAAAITEAAASILFLADTIKENPVDFAKTFVGDLSLLDKLQAKLKAAKEFTEQERRARAGQEKLVKDDAEIESAAKREATQELRLIEAGIKGREDALRLIDQSEERFAQQSLDRARQLEEEKIRLIERRGDIIRSVEDIEAERAGPSAELELQTQRAAAAGVAARAAAADGIDLSEQEAVLEAQQEAARLQRMLESNLTRRGFDDQTAARMARSQAAGIAGALPGAESLRDITTRPDVNTPQKVTLEQVPQLSDVLNKLDTLIQKAGSFN